MDHSTLVQVWRGGFLDATPMWHERGDGSSRPTGSKQLFGKPVLNVERLSSATHHGRQILQEAVFARRVMNWMKKIVPFSIISFMDFL
jgi:hypothetical protein